MNCLEHLTFKLVVVDIVPDLKHTSGYACSTHHAGKHSRAQRVKQLPIFVSLDVEEKVKINLHSGNMYRCVQWSQPQSVVCELLAVSGLGVEELALQIDAPKKFNCVVHEMRDVTGVFVQMME